MYSNKAIMKAEIQEVSEVIYKKIGDFLTFGTSSEFYAFSFVLLHFNLTWVVQFANEISDIQ